MVPGVMYMNICVCVCVDIRWYRSYLFGSSCNIQCVQVTRVCSLVFLVKGESLSLSVVCDHSYSSPNLPPRRGLIYYTVVDRRDVQLRAYVLSVTFITLLVHFCDETTCTIHMSMPRAMCHFGVKFGVKCRVPFWCQVPRAILVYQCRVPVPRAIFGAPECRTLARLESLHSSSSPKATFLSSNFQFETRARTTRT